MGYVLGFIITFSILTFFGGIGYLIYNTTSYRDNCMIQGGIVFKTLENGSDVCLDRNSIKVIKVK